MVQAIKPIEPWNIIHTANDSYTGFILPRTHDTHQWLPLQFVILLMMDANCVRNMQSYKNQINRSKLHLVGIYITSITKMHGTMNIKFP